MAEGKKSFILYADIIHTVGKLPKEKAGELFMHILEYVNDMNPETDDLILQLSFEPIKQALKRDLKRYEQYIEKQKVNGSKGGRPLKETQALNEKPKKPKPFSENPHKPKKADSVSVSVIDSVNDSDSVIVKESVCVDNTPAPDLDFHGNYETVAKHTLNDEHFIEQSAMYLRCDKKNFKVFVHRKLNEMRLTSTIGNYPVTAIRRFLLKDYTKPSPEQIKQYEKQVK